MTCFGVEASEKHRGISWVAGKEVGKAELGEVARLGVEWIAQTPFGWMKSADDDSVRLTTKGHIYWGERDSGLGSTHRFAKELGLKTVMKPHLWIRDSWPGEVAMSNEENWKAWFASYTTFILHYARLSEELGVDMLVIGTELKQTTRLRKDDWLGLIEKIRKTYSGPLTYAANWDEAWQVPFWPKLDYIGVNAYFPLTNPDGTQPKTTATIAKAWQPTKDRLATLSKLHNRPIIFTEIGYRASTDCTVRPWQHKGGTLSPTCQLQATQALFTEIWPEPWLAGLYIWKWPPHHPTPTTPNFSPRNRPAQKTIKLHYQTKSRPASEASRSKAKSGLRAKQCRSKAACERSDAEAKRPASEAMQKQSGSKATRESEAVATGRTAVASPPRRRTGKEKRRRRSRATSTTNDAGVISKRPQEIETSRTDDHTCKPVWMDRRGAAGGPARRGR